jgi:hypothetical protein
MVCHGEMYPHINGTAPPRREEGDAHPVINWFVKPINYSYIYHKHP